LRITDERRGDEIHLLLETTHCSDLTITLTAELQNMRSSRPLPLTIETRDHPSMELTTLRIPAAGGAWRYTYHYEWRYGGRGGKPDGTVYELPYRGSTHRLIQGYRGRFSHEQGSPNEYALDWSMPEGTAIRAARGGTVVGVRQDGTTGGASRDFLNCANYVIIRHADNTYGEYLHLQPNGAQVKLGDQVETGQVIARSGNTGFSSGPHLHFAVFRTIDGTARETLPVQFHLADGSVGTLAQGRVY
jgi:murein DD-endopeptidase MepM/ murein hydrolase activator NlpD